MEPRATIRDSTAHRVTWRWEMPRSWRAGAVVLMILAMLLGAPSSALGADDTPIITTSDGGKDALSFTAGDDGSTSTLTVTNPADAPITLEVAGLDNLADCSNWDLAPSTIAPNRTTTVEIETSCTIPESGKVQLTAAPGGSIATLAVTAKDPSPTVELDTILIAFGVALGVAIVTALVLWWRRPRVKKMVDRPEPGTKPTGVWAEPWDDKKDTYNEALFPEGKEAGFRQELPGVDAKWSFTDSWATSVSTIGTLVVALLSTSDVLTALLGEKPEAFLANVLVAGAIAAFFTGAAPLVTKAVGTSTKPSVGGVLVGGVLTMTGVAGQLWVIGWQFGQLAIAAPMPEGLRLVLPFLLALAIFAYGYATLRLLLRDAFESPIDRPVVLPLDQATTIAVEVLPDHADNADILKRAKSIRKDLALAAVGIQGEVVTEIPTPSPSRALLAPVVQAETSAIL